MEQEKKPGWALSFTPYFQKSSTVFLACMAGIFVLHVIGGYQQITRNKVVLLFLLAGGYILAVFLGKLRLGAEEKPRSGLTPIQWAVVAYWAAVLISAVLSVDIKISLLGSGRFNGLMTTTLYCAVFLLLSRSHVSEKWFTRILAGSMVLCCIVAIVQFFGKNPLGLYPEGLNYYDANIRYGGEFLGTIGNADVLSAVFCIAIPIFWISVLRLRSPWRFALLIPLILCLAVLVKASVAGGVIGVAAGALFTLPVVMWKKEHRLVYGILSAALFAVFVVLVYFFGGKVGGSLAEASALLHGHWDDSFGSSRLYIWRKTAELIPERLLFGGGPDTLGLRTDAYFERFNTYTGTMIHTRVDDAHNEYLHILVNQGLVALLAYLAILISTAVHWVRQAPENDTVAICGGAAFCYCIQALFGISSPISASLLWICLALCAGAAAKPANQ